MKQYHDLLKEILEFGEQTGDRTGTGTISRFAPQSMRFDLREGFPLVTTKKVFTKGVVHELLWFISGDTNIKYLQDNGVKIWDEWADENDDLGPVYGKQWRKWSKPYIENDVIYNDHEGIYEDFSYMKDNPIDQLQNVIDRIKSNPTCRRLIVSAWNVGELDDMALMPCHCLFQFKVYGEYLDLQLYQRSADVFLGTCFNVASYALLLEMVAQVTGKKARYFINAFGDAHIYNNHMDQVNLQLTREPFDLPILRLNPDIKNINDFKYEDIEILNYECHPAIKGEVSV